MSSFYQNRTEKLHCFISINNTFSSHLHRHIELIFVLNGTIHIRIDHAEYDLHEGDNVIIFPNQLHEIKTPDNSRIFLSIFDNDICPQYSNLFLEKVPSMPIFRLESLNNYGKEAANNLLLLEPFFHRNLIPTKETLSITEGYLSILLTVLLSKMSLANRSSNLELEQSILIYIDTHYKEDLSLELLSNKFGLSRFGISRIFSDKLHISFPNYVNLKRLEYAANLLKSTKMSVTDIALESGFNASRTFFRAFKEVYCTTPAQFRKQYGGII